MSKKTESFADISLEKLLPFQEHPFLVRDDEQMAMIVESIRSVGVLVSTTEIRARNRSRIKSRPFLKSFRRKKKRLRGFMKKQQSSLENAVRILT